MSDVINLRLARKRKARADKERQAGENRIRFGRSKIEKLEAQTAAERDGRLLDGHKRERTDGDGK